MSPSDDTTNDALRRLAQTASEAAERGDVPALHSLLDIVAEQAPSSSAEGAREGAHACTDRCRELLSAFLSLIGRRQDELDVPPSMKAHLLLRALLRIPHEYSTPWEAATAAVQSLQYQRSAFIPRSEGSSLSHGEELAVIGEIRSFATLLRTERKGRTNPTQINERLLELASAIVAPLLMNARSDDSSQSGNQATGRVRRQNHYLLPLQLIPAILATMDSMDDMRESLPRENGSVVKAEGGDAMHVESGDIEGLMHVRTSDRLLSSMFASISDNVNGSKKLQRAMRADASLPLLSLALDDVGVPRMSATLSIEDSITYWDCLAFALNDAISANLMCHSGEEAEEESKQQILKEALADEGVHIIPLSDYPALMRCVFRMVAGSFVSDRKWEHVLLRLYHACAVATSASPLPTLKRPKSSGEVDRPATLSTVESHVLIPSCTGASVSTVKSILEACIRASCPSCMQDARSKVDRFATNQIDLDNEDAVPLWAVAGLALLIMRARASSLSHSATSASFGPRAVFRIASDIMRKREADDPTASGGSDEVGYALSVLLHLSRFKDGTCHACRDGSFLEHAEKSARDVLGHSYYAKGQFCHRYAGPGDYSYLQQLGSHTLSSYSHLVRASLHHGALHNAGKVQTSDSFVANTARTWIDVANMLLDESDRHQLSMRMLNGTALAVVIFIVVFFEVPPAQDGIVRSIYDRVANMASHNLHGRGSEGEKAWFVLAFVLAWSLVEMERTCLSIDVVRRRGGRENRDHVASVLGPLCSLLSKSAQGHLHGPTGSSEGLPFWAIRQLAHAMSPIPSGRDAILAMAQKNMSVLSASSPYSHQQYPVTAFFESLPSTPSATNDAIYLALDSLCLLVETDRTSNDSPSADDCCREAVRVLTDIMVLQRPSASSHLFSAMPCVPREFILWILDELDKSARLGKLSHWSSQRLLRACYFAMLQSTSFEQKDGFHPYFAQHARNDIPALLRLALSLYDRLAKDELVLQSHSFLRPYVERALKNSQSNEAIDDSIKHWFHAGFNVLQLGFDPLKSSIDGVVDGVFLVIVVESAAKMTQKKRSCPEQVNTAVWKSLTEYIRQAEKHHHSGVEKNDTLPSHGSPLPSWIEAQDPFSPSEFTLSMGSNRLQQSLCDVIAELLLQMWARRPTTAEMNDRGLSILLSVHSLLGCKRAEHNPAGTSPEKVGVLGGAMSQESICSLLELSSQHLRSLLGNSENQKDALANVDLVARNLIDACQAIQLGTTSQCESRLLTSFWALYCSLADDESSQLFCSFVKECYIKIGKYATETEAADYDISESSYSLRMVTSGADLDYHVRHLRGVFLSTLSTVIASIPASKAALSLDERKTSLEILVQILPQICQDLDAGFHGYSGGLTKKLMLLFLDVMEKCIDAMAAVFGSLPATDQYQLRKSFVSVHQSAIILWDIFREDSLRQASIVKGALRLCIDKMPSLIRRVERIVDERIVDESLCEHLCTALDECTASSTSELNEKDTRKSGDVVAVSNSVGSNDARAALPGGAEIDALNSVPEDNEGEDFIIASKEQPKEAGAAEATGNAPTGDVEHAQAQKFPAKTLPWAYNCSFAAVVSLFGESYRIVTSRSKVDGRRSNHSRETLPALALRRVGDYSRVHASICRLFGEKSKPVGKADDAKTDPADETPMILADALSHHGKSSMCSCVEKMATTLSLAVKHVVKYCEQPKPSCVETKVNESMVCLMGWLHSLKTNAAKCDFITGTLQWYINEKRHFDVSMFKDGSYPILGRLPKVIFRLEGLEAELRKLDVLVADLSGRDDVASKAKMSVLNQWMSQPQGNKDEEFGDLLQNCVETLDTRKNALKLSELEGDLASDDEDESDADLEGEDFAWNGKRRRQRYAPVRKSRRLALRSRNETIDNWLAMDDDEFGAAPGERYNADDAFVDLEDFLVEG